MREVALRRRSGIEDMSLINLYDVDIGMGAPVPLLEGVALSVEPGERICVLGRNGSGKTTLLKLLAGDIEPDGGTVRFRRGIRTARLAQEVPPGTAGAVFDVVAHGAGALGDRLAERRRLSESAPGAGHLATLGQVEARIDAEDGWDVERRVREVITRLGLDPASDFARLSGGVQRRVLLARALVAAPDVLLLDEPTNHLDIDNIEWLETFLRDFPGSLVFVTHDRSFLRALATRIVEIDRGRVSSWPGDYEGYLRRREERSNAEARADARLDKRLAQEEAWIRQGLKARRRRNMGRVRELQAMRGERAARREREGRVRMEPARAARSGERVVEAERVCFGWGGEPVVRDFSTAIVRGDRVGIIGPNGSGKTTLVRLLLGELTPQAGTVRLGTNLQVAYFDQQRARLDEGATALDNVAGGREFIEINGRRKHALSYLQDFLFTPARARAPITALSGGERNRLLLARLFSEPSNVLVMDEPTNDLDIETLELLEELVAEYRGTLLLVSHDRAFLDNVVTGVLVLAGGGRVEEYVGGYSDWLARREPPAPAPAKGTARKSARTARPRQKRGLNMKEKRELQALPDRIEALEVRVGQLTERLSDPSLYRHQGDEVRRINEELHAAQEELEQAYRRWQALDELATS